MPMVLWISGLGFVSGLFANLWAQRLILSREPEIALPNWLIHWQAKGIAWPLIGVISCNLLAVNTVLVLDVLIRAAWLVALMALSAVDLSIRKIPNQTILLLLLTQLIRLVIEFSWQNLGQSVGGLVTGYFLFSMPALFGKSIGRGDIKLAAVIGFCLGTAGMLQSIVVLGLLSSLFFLLLILTRRGNLRTKVPIGPLLSIGMLLSVQYPLFDKVLFI